MAGFFGGLFNRKAEAADAANPNDADTFFLDADRAKTYGDIDYMRTAKTVRKTFPKMKGSQEGLEVIEQISATKKSDITGTQNSSAGESFKPQPSTQTSPQSAERSRSDTSMDMFRNMARGIKKS